MKITIIVSIVMLSIITFAFAQANGWEEDGLRGKVRSLTVERSELLQKAGGTVEDQRRPVENVSYAFEGEKIEETHYSSSGALLWTFLYQYSADGKRTSMQCRLANGSISEKLVFVYDSDRRIESDTLAPDGTLREKSSYVYDESGNTTEIDEVGADGSSVGRWTYHYDDKGRVREWTAFSADGTIFEESSYTHDSEGRLKVAAQYRADNTLERKVTYDSKGNEIEAEKDAADGTLLWKRTYEYNFDSAGNWVKKTTKELSGSSNKSDFAMVEIEYRTIQYY